MSKIYLIRHCQAEGQDIDADLTEVGKEQSVALAKFLVDIDIQGIVSSHFLRAQHTILPLSKALNIPIAIDKRLGERVLSSESMPDWAEALKKTYEDLDLKYKGGESSREATDRAIRCIKECLLEEKSLALVTHGGLLSFILKHYDSRFGYEDWKKLTNPDVYCLNFVQGDRPEITRIWEEQDASVH